MVHRFWLRRALLAVSPALLFLASCTVTEQDLVRQGGRIDDLNAKLMRLERAVAEARPTAPAPDPEGGRRIADLGQRVEELAKQVQQFEGRAEAIERGSAKAPKAAELETRVAALADRLAALEARPQAPKPPAAPAAPKPAAAPPASPAPGPAPASTALAPSPPPAPKLSGQALYDQAYNVYKQGKYSEAREFFGQYIQENPDTSLTDNAYFWIGEIHYDQGQYEQAILEYDKAIQKFPKGDKVSSALLKQAFAFDAIGDPVDARILLRKILREHPSSEQAAIARKKLELLGE